MTSSEYNSEANWLTVGVSAKIRSPKFQNAYS